MRAHHGSLSREQRLVIESDLKAGRLKAIVATSSLELGIDMGSVDLVVLVESPGSVARGMQRVGRAGHQVGEPSTGKIFPKYRGDLLEATAVARRMREGLVEEMRYPRNPIDVLAQQIVAAVAVDEWDVDALYAMVRRSANFAELSEDVFREVLDMLAGRYPSDRFAGLRPRVVWDRVQGRVRAREGAQRVAIASGGTIPDRGLFGVFLPDGVRVGELDEEMVYESRGGRDVRARRDHLADRGDHVRPRRRDARAGRTRQDTVLAGRPARDGRSSSGGRWAAWCASCGTSRRTQPKHGCAPTGSTRTRRRTCGATSKSRASPPARCRTTARSWSSASPTRSATGASASSRRSARACTRPGRSRSRNDSTRADMPVQVLWSDDGIILRLPEAIEDIPLDLLLFEPDEVEELVVERLPSTSLFSSRFRENAARSLLLPRRRPGRAHAAVAATAAGGRSARGRVRLSGLPDAARDDA